MDVKDKLKEFFENENIEYYSVLRYSDCIESSPAIMSREDFIPRSVIVFLVPYYTGETVNISRYAASLDYHIVIKDISGRLETFLKGEFPECSLRAYGDHSPIYECHAATIGGLGIRGDNGLLINEKYGSYVFIGDTVTDIDPELLGAVKPCEIQGCYHCGSCLTACPTGVLSGIGKDCLSAITQKKGELDKEEQSLLVKHGTVWGCDICQSVCPYNANPKRTPVEFFYKDRIEELTLDILDSMDKSTFQKRAFAWRGRRVVERNLEILKKGADSR